MRPLFSCWSEVAARLDSRPTIALFLDFDGTLTPIQPRPELVRVNPAVRRVLATLAARPRFRVCVISARRRDDVRSRLGVAAVRYLGLYGWERSATPPPPGVPIIQVRTALEDELASYPGLYVEDKRHSVSVHYRGCPEPVRKQAAAFVRRVVAPWHGLLRITRGKCVWEVVPLELGDKGAAVRRELAGLQKPALPVYVGDDVSDEPGFASASQGVTVRVGSRRSTRAHYRVDGAAQVLQFLERLQAEFR